MTAGEPEDPLEHDPLKDRVDHAMARVNAILERTHRTLVRSREILGKKGRFDPVDGGTRSSGNSAHPRGR